MIPCSLPALFVDIDLVGSPIIIMFSNIVIPFGIAAALMTGGVYDLIVSKML